MKKAMIWLLLIALLLPSTSGIAEGTGGPEELCFQGISWFSSPNDAINALVDLGLLKAKPAGI